MSMNSNISNELDAGKIYTDFQGLARLRASASQKSPEANEAVAKQFEALYLQMMMKSMRQASEMGGSSESDQTRFYQEMFDKQIALDLSNNGGIGLSSILEKELGGVEIDNESNNVSVKDKGVVVNEQGFWAVRHQLSQIVDRNSLMTDESMTGLKNEELKSVESKDDNAMMNEPLRGY